MEAGAVIILAATAVRVALAAVDLVVQQTSPEALAAMVEAGLPRAGMAVRERTAVRGVLEEIMPVAPQVLLRAEEVGAVAIVVEFPKMAAVVEAEVAIVAKRIRRGPIRSVGWLASSLAAAAGEERVA